MPYQLLILGMTQVAWYIITANTSSDLKTSQVKILNDVIAECLSVRLIIVQARRALVGS